MGQVHTLARWDASSLAQDRIILFAYPFGRPLAMNPWLLVLGTLLAPFALADENCETSSLLQKGTGERELALSDLSKIRERAVDWLVVSNMFLNICPSICKCLVG